jgi:hypothetical protein
MARWLTTEAQSAKRNIRAFVRHRYRRGGPMHSARGREDGRGRAGDDYGSGGWGFESLAAHPTCINPNTLRLATPLVSGPVIHLPGQYGKVRRDGYRFDRS